MDAFRGVPASAGARDFVRLAIFARSVFPGPRAGARTIDLAHVAGLRRILGDIVAGFFALVGGDRVQFIRLLGIDLLGRALRRASGQQGQAGYGRDGQAGPHFIPRSNGQGINARAAIWCAA